jgi:membrane protease YdiL (CAAX protease family)
MEPGIQTPAPAASPAGIAADTAGLHEPLALAPDLPELHDLHWALVGSQGLRAGWSVLIFVLLYRLFNLFLGSIAVQIDPAIARSDFSPTMALIGELIPLLALLAAAAFVARIESRNLLAYNLTGPRRTRHFFSGMGAGFVALSALVGALAWGGWLHFGPIALSGTAICKYGALWGVVFLLVGFFEEGAFRCYLQFTLTRGINFWWALGIVAGLCLDVLLRSRGHAGILAFIFVDKLPALKGNSAWGIYAIALLGLFPCLTLHRKHAPGSGFWQAAWASSTLFGFIHTSNNGENWIGIFAAAAIGFVFCVSVRVTGSAWWAIGCHTAWDWAETYFYGTADSGLPAKGHYLTTNPTGNALWSGGTDGPEGSLLVVGIILLLLVALLVMYGRGSHASLRTPATEQTAG